LDVSRVLQVRVERRHDGWKARAAESGTLERVRDSEIECDSLRCGVVTQAGALDLVEVLGMAWRGHESALNRTKGVRRMREMEAEVDEIVGAALIDEPSAT
jgi:hypothetical protein